MGCRGILPTHIAKYVFFYFAPPDGGILIPASPKSNKFELFTCTPQRFPGSLIMIGHPVVEILRSQNDHGTTDRRTDRQTTFNA